MNDPRPPLSDEDLSAAIDGEAGADVVDRIAADPDAQARMAELQGAADALGVRVAPLGAGVVDDLVARALQAADDPRGETEADAIPDDDDAVVPLAPRRSARRGPPTWVVAAAIVLLAGTGLILAWTGRDGSSTNDSAAKVSASAERTRADADTGAASKTGADSGAVDPHAPATAPSNGYSTGTSRSSAGTLALGAYATGADLRTALARTFAPSTTATASGQAAGPTTPSTASLNDSADRLVVPSKAAVDRCAEQVKITLGLSTDPLHRGYAAVDDEPVFVYDFATNASISKKDTTIVAAVGQAACDPVVTFLR